MHRKSLEAAHQFTSGDESNKDNDYDDDGGHSSGDENDKVRRGSSGKKLSITNHPPESELNYTASYQINGRTIDDFRMNSVAELRAKAAEHQARIAGALPAVSHHQTQPIQQQHALPQREGEFLISSDSSSDSF